MPSLSPAPVRATASALDAAFGVTRIAEGFVGFVATASGIARLTLPQPDARQAMERLLLHRTPGARLDTARFTPLAERLERYFAGEPVAFDDLTLDLSGATPFQRRVLETVRGIPRGQTRSYAEVAALAGRPGAARAVGAVMAANPVCVVIPCHRVVGSDGNLTGFGGGLALKRRMLALEGVRVD